MSALLSVIIPVYKVEQYLDQCVESVVNQTYRNLDIILVDDGSPDKCGAMCDAWAEKDSRIRVVHKQNEGLGFARNSGLDVANGEYFAFLDSDDYLDNTIYERLMEKALKTGADIAVSVTGVAGPDSAYNGIAAGTVFIGISKDNNSTAYEYHFKGNRNEVRAQAVNSALDLILNKIGE